MGGEGEKVQALAHSTIIKLIANVMDDDARAYAAPSSGV